MLQRNGTGQRSMKWRYITLLTASLAAYLCVGAVIFRATERESEKKARQDLRQAYLNFLNNHSCVSEDAILSFTEQVFRSGLHTSKGNTWSPPLDENTSLTWDFPGSLTFALTVVTTIGYGHVYPNTELGRGLCIVYALLGIPLTLIFLGAVGDKMIHVALRIGRLKWSSRSASLNKLINAGVIVLTGMVVMFILPSVIFHLVEDWSYSRALYYSFVTLSTIGFGDDVAGLMNRTLSEELHHVYKVFVYLWILAGLSYLSVVIKFIIRFYIRRADNVKKRVTITMLRGGRQRVIVKKKRFANDRFIRDLLCASCFDKLLTLADKGYQLNKLFSYRKNKREKMEREHSILRRSNTVAEFQIDPDKQEERAEMREKQRLPRVSSMPNLRYPDTPERETTSTRQEVASEDDWEISVEEVAKDQVLESDGELVTVRVVAQGDELKSFGHENRGYDEDVERDFHTVSSKTRTVDDITFKFAEGFLTKGHSLTNLSSEPQKKPKPFFSRSFKHRVIGSKTQKPLFNKDKPSPQIKVYFGDTAFGNTRLAKAKQKEDEFSNSSPISGKKFLGHSSLDEDRMDTFVKMENEFNKKDIKLGNLRRQEKDALQLRRDAFRSFKKTLISDNSDSLSSSPQISHEFARSQRNSSYKSENKVRNADSDTPNKSTVKYSFGPAQDARFSTDGTYGCVDEFEAKKDVAELSVNDESGSITRDSICSDNCDSASSTLQKKCSDISRAGDVTSFNSLLNDGSAPAVDSVKDIALSRRYGESCGFRPRDKSDSGYCESDDIT